MGDGESQPPRIEPRAKAARKTEMRKAQGMMDDPKYGASRREPSSW
jgi:hypothetical protein